MAGLPAFGGARTEVRGSPGISPEHEDRFFVLDKEESRREEPCRAGCARARPEVAGTERRVASVDLENVKVGDAAAIQTAVKERVGVGVLMRLRMLPDFAKKRFFLIHGRLLQGFRGGAETRTTFMVDA